MKSPQPQLSAANATMVRRLRFGPVGPLFMVSALLALPFGFLAFYGWFCIVPPFLWIVGMILVIGCPRTSTGVRLIGGFWWLSSVYNLLGCGVWVYLLMVNLAGNETTTSFPIMRSPCNTGNVHLSYPPHSEFRVSSPLRVSFHRLDPEVSQ